MKKISFWILSLLGLLWLFGSVIAQTDFDPMNMPALTEYVQDFSTVLTTTQRDELRNIAYDYFSGTSTQIATVLFPHRNGNELVDIGVKYFNDNGIGQAKGNNGILLLISTQEKKLRIVVGYGLEWAIPDIEAKKIVEEIRPYIVTDQYYEGVKKFYELSIEAINSAWDNFESSDPLAMATKGTLWWVLYSIVSVLVMFGGIVFGWYLPFRKKRAFPEKMKRFFGGEKKRAWKIFLGIVFSYVIGIILLGILVPVIDSIPLVRHALMGFIPSFGIALLLALIPRESMKWWSGGWNWYSGYRSSSSSFSSSSSSSSSYRGFSGGGGRTGWGWAGD